MKPFATNPNRVVERLRLLIDRLIPANITLEIDLLVSANNILADPAQLELALMNVAMNARDAMPDGGRLSIITREKIVDHELSRRVNARPGVYVTIAVRDTGAGMDANTAERISEPFFSVKETGRSSAMGLSGAYGAVRSMGGFITIETAPGRGSTITISLPKVMAICTTRQSRYVCKPWAAAKPFWWSRTILPSSNSPAIRCAKKAIRY